VSGPNQQAEKKLKQQPNWMSLHTRSEMIAIEADELRYRKGTSMKALDLYKEAAELEAQAVVAILPDKKTYDRTYGNLCVNVVALYYRGRDFEAAEGKAREYMADRFGLPRASYGEIERLLRKVEHQKIPGRLVRESIDLQRKVVEERVVEHERRIRFARDVMEKEAAPPAPPDFLIGKKLKKVISNAIRESGKTREEICEQINALTDIGLTLHTLNSWLSEAHDHGDEGIEYVGKKRWGIPAEMLPALCFFTNNYAALDITAFACDRVTFSGRAVIWAMWGQPEEKRAITKMEIKELEDLLLEQEKDKERRAEDGE